MRQESPSFAARTDPPRPGQVSPTRRIFRASYSARSKCVTEGEGEGEGRDWSGDRRKIHEKFRGGLAVTSAREFLRPAANSLSGNCERMMACSRAERTRCHSRERRWERGRGIHFPGLDERQNAKSPKRCSTLTTERYERIHPPGPSF
jgi:hypothetical protein